MLLADGRVNAAADNNYAIHWAILGGFLKIVRALLADDRVAASNPLSGADYLTLAKQRRDALLSPKTERGRDL